MLQKWMFFLLCALIISCSDSSEDSSETSVADDAEEVTQTPYPGDSEATPTAPAPGERSEEQKAAANAANSKKAAYVLTPFTDSPQFEDAELHFKSYENGMFNFEVNSTTYKLGDQTDDADSKSCANSAQGQHIHLIVDNGPYAAKYEPSFEYEMTDGPHFVLAFLSRSYHESIKTKKAHKAFLAKVENGELQGTGFIRSPTIFYSRPKGVYEGKDTEKVMLDYYLLNTVPGEHKVKADINDQSFILDEWKPYYIEGLPAGENRITLTLLDKDGNPVDHPMNPAEGKFVLNPDPPVN